MAEQSYTEQEVTSNIIHSIAIATGFTDEATIRQAACRAVDLYYGMATDTALARLYFFLADGQSQHPVVAKFKSILLGYTACPTCGHAWNAHSAWIAHQKMECEEVSA